MTSVPEQLTENTDSLFQFFNQVFLFGSYLDTDTYDDIDFLLVYRSENDLPDVSFEVHRTLSKLSSVFPGLQIDPTVLSDIEFESTGFLRSIGRYAVIKC